MLNEFILITPEQLPEMVKRWKGLYNPRTVQHAIQERLKYTPDDRLEEAIGKISTRHVSKSPALCVFGTLVAAIYDVLAHVFHGAPSKEGRINNEIRCSEHTGQEIPPRFLYV